MTQHPRTHPNQAKIVRMLYKTLSAAVYGIDANIIQVEVDCSGIKTDQDHFHTVGLPDAAVRESRDRVRAALKNCGYDIPPTHITINLAPADIKKEGSGFDLPMALGIVGAYGGLTNKEINDCLFVGELSLDGSVRGVRGALPIALEARGRKIKRMVVPEANAKEAAMVGGVDVYPVRSLLDVIHFLNSGNGIAPIKADGDSMLRESQQFFVDFKDVRGQQTAKRAIEISCAGGHNILMIGPPPARARPCSPSACPPSCLHSPSKKPSRPPRSTALPESLIPAAAWSANAPTAHPTTPSLTPA
jgi:magnesium chelatase family protein